MTPDKIALNTVSLRFDNFEATINATAAAGFRSVELPLSHLKTDLAKGWTLERMRDLIQQRGLTVCGGFDGQLRTFADAASVRESHDDLVKNAEMIAFFGGKTMVAGTDYVAWPGPREYADPLGRIADSIGAVADRIRPLGISILIEFNWGAVKSLLGAAEIAKRSGRPNVGVLFDIAHMHCTPTKTEHLTADIVPYIHHVHVDNMPAKPAETTNCNSDRVLPGDPRGLYDLPKIFGTLAAHGYRGSYAIEMFSDELWALPPAEAAKRCYASMQTVFPLLR